MKKFLYGAAALIAVVCLTLVIPPFRHAVAEAIASAIGATGSTAPSLTLQVGGSDGTNLRTLKTSADGTLQSTTTGAAASGAATSGNPVLVAGSDGANVQTLTVAASGSSPTNTNLLKIGTEDFAGGSIRPLFTASQGSAYPSRGVPIVGIDGAGTTRYLPISTTGSAAPPNTLQVGGLGFNQISFPARFCDKVAQVNTTIASSASTKQIVAGVASQNLYVCSYQLAISTATTGTAITWVEGTGSDCATGQTTVQTPLITSPTSAPTTPNVTQSPVNPGIPFTATAGDALCLKQASTTNTTTITGSFTYTQN